MFNLMRKLKHFCLSYSVRHSKRQDVGIGKKDNENPLEF